MQLPRRKRTRLTLIVAAALAVGLAIAFGVAISAQPPESGPAVKSHASHADIWSVDLSTRELTQRTLNADALEPSWSPEGEIAFSTAPCDECLSEIHLDGQGSAETAVEAPARHLYQPSWAPDGNRFAVIRLGRGVWVVDVAQKSARQLTSNPTDEAPAWSAAGEWIAFDRLVASANYDLFMVHAQSGELRRLTKDKVAQTHPAFAPDGTRLAYAEQQPNGKWGIVSVTLEGQAKRRVTPASISAQEPAFSPDGRRIAFILQELDRATVAVRSADGTGPITRLTDGSLYPARPVWSPDGQSIAFSATAVQP
jgi:Tol biopolymer transport system component